MYHFLIKEAMIKEDVGLHAGDIYTLLSQKGRMTLRKIGELTNQKESAIFLSLGWLLREDKISISKENGEWYFELENIFSEMYY